MRKWSIRGTENWQKNQKLDSWSIEHGEQRKNRQINHKTKFIKGLTLKL